ncbi:hypothetical protein ACPC54_23990 [Kitasatospora sp. NPDC094028]
MTVKARHWNLLIAGVGIAGLLMLTTEADPALAGILTGAAIAGIACLVVLDRRLAQIGHQSDELAESRAQYEAARATLTGQRARLRAAMEAELAQRLAEMEDRHKHELIRSRADGYVEGATDALAGRRVAPGGDQADVISLAARRQSSAPTIDSTR